MIARRFLFVGPFLVVIIFALSACRYTTAASPAAPHLPGMSFSLTGDECPSLDISAGDRVTWTNQTSQPRQLTAQTLDGEILFDSGILKQGDIFALIFPEAGTYSYTCWSEQAAPATITVQP